MMIPRFVNWENEKYTYNNEKIYISDNFKDDKYYINNVLCGKIISSHIYPILFNDYNDHDVSLNKFRSIKFYNECTYGIFESLEDEEKSYFLIGLRDLFFANEAALLDKITDYIDIIYNGFEYQGLNVSFYPTKYNKMIRIIENKMSFDDNNYFASLTNNTFLYVFINPAELSFHNFDNILCLDRFIGRKRKITFMKEKYTNNFNQYSITGLDKLI